jgi:acyl carrier protein
MEELIEKLKEILEVETLDLDLKFEDCEEWDSLSSLSIIAILDSDYGITINNKEIINYPTIKDFCNFVISHGKQ